MAEQEAGRGDHNYRARMDVPMERLAGLLVGDQPAKDDELVEEACDEIERLRGVLPDEIRGTPWRWRICADCAYTYWALDYDHRVCNDCGSPHVTDYVPSDPATPTPEADDGG